jgi:hypothetical protein
MIALPTFRGILARGSSVDPDASAYFSRITAAGSSITTANQSAVNAFIVGCKADGIWNAIKASCLLAGPNDLTGALVPLVGTAPSNIGPFISGDYSRTTGLIGDGVSKRLDSNYNNNADAQNDRHMAFWATTINSGGERAYMGGAVTAGGSRLRLQTATNNMALFISSSIAQTINDHAVGFTGATRTASTTTSYRNNGVTTAGTTTSETPADETQTVIGITGNATQCNGRISYYSFGQSLNLSLLDARLATYMASLT